MKRYKLWFTGRKVGAIGKFQQFSVTIWANNEREATLALYETHEHISNLKIEKLTNKGLTKMNTTALAELESMGAVNGAGEACEADPDVIKQVKSAIEAEAKPAQPQGDKGYAKLVAICKEIANDPRCDLVDSERRIRLYAALESAGEL